MITSTLTPAYLPAGATFVNGTDGPHAKGFNWSERLTVVHRDPMAIGCIRYIVTDRYGRRGYAFA